MLADKGSKGSDCYFPVSLDLFFKKLVPSSCVDLTSTQLKTIRDFSDVPYAATEDCVSGSLCEVFKTLRCETKSPYVILDAPGPGRVDKSVKIQDMGPRLSLYDSKFLGFDWFTPRDEEQAQVKGHQRPRACWAWMTSFIEVICSPDSAPFNFDGTGGFEVKDTDAGKQAYARVVKYVSEIMHHQHRTFVLCALIWRDWVRFIRWDRAGAIISAADNYVKNPRRLLNFVHRISGSPPEGQGYDPTVTFLNHRDPHIAERLAAARNRLSHKHQVDFFEGAFGGDMDEYPLCEVHCEDVPYRTEDREASSDADREQAPLEHRTNSYWISMIHAGTRSLTGRGTRGFVAIDIDHSQMVFLKDYWCPNLEGIHPELETYARLRTSHVRYVATALAGGVVFGSTGQPQTTMTQDSLRLKQIPSDGHTNTPPQAFHYRFVVREIGHPLETYESAGQLWDIVSDSLVGHQDAYEKAKVLHRDISAKNIMINPLTKRGLIVDWDLAKHMDTDRELKSSQSGRSGTWPFMSAKLLQLPKKPNDLADDLESFIYVICVMFLCYHDHSLSPRNAAEDVKDFSAEGNARNVRLSQFIADMFYSNIMQGRYHYGGVSKLTRIKEGTPGFEMGDETLDLGICKLYALLKLHYEAFPVEDLQPRWGVPKPAAFVPIVPIPVWTMQERLRQTRGDDFDPTVYQTTQIQPVRKAGSCTASSSAASRPIQGAKTTGLNTHRIILGIFFDKDLLLANWPNRCDKTFPQFVNLPNTDGTVGTEVPSSLAGSFDRHSKRLDSNEVDQSRDNKRSRMAVS